ncbi:MAG: DUF1232 domain-containing protein [Desulfobacteraceae bacterium]|nr:MAG: DUF1232 domain-containing protein [Desulfobacteraceae bacterium]
MPRLKQGARFCKQQIYALSIACRDPRMPWYAKALTALIVAYALSPIDLVPDFIPILGYLDDLILLPLGIMLVLRMIPPQVLAESRAKAAARGEHDLKRSKLGAAVIIGLWAMGFIAVSIYFIRLFKT